MTSIHRFGISIAALVMLASTGGSASAELPDTIAAAEASEPRALVLGDDDETIVADDDGVSRLDAFGDRIARVDFDTPILDLAIEPTTSSIAVLREDALVVLDPSLATLWSRPLRAPAGEGRIATGEHGTFAIATDDRVQAFDEAGRLRFAERVDVDSIAAIAVLDEAGLVVVGGMRRAQPVLVALDRDGEVRWDASHDIRSISDAQIVDVRRGADDALYVLAASTSPTEPTARVAWFARMTSRGTIAASTSLGFADAFSTVRPDAIDADTEGNVYVVGATSHELDIHGEAAVEAPGGAVGFYQVLAPDLTTRRVWRQFALDDLEGERVRLAVADDRAVAIIPATHDDAARIVALPTDPDQAKVERQPDRDDVGTFGYESGVSGADPTCYCDARRETPPAWWAGAIVVIVLARPRRRA